MATYLGLMLKFSIMVLILGISGLGPISLRNNSVNSLKGILLGGNNEQRAGKTIPFHNVVGMHLPESWKILLFVVPIDISVVLVLLFRQLHCNRRLESLDLRRHI